MELEITLLGPDLDFVGRRIGQDPTGLGAAAAHSQLGPRALDLAAPPRRYEWVARDSGEEVLTVRTRAHGPVQILRRHRLDVLRFQVGTVMPDARAVARPDAVAATLDQLRVDIRRLAANDDLSIGDRGHLFAGLVDRAAILLLDPDSEARRARIHSFLEREAVRRASYVEPRTVAGGSPGLGRRG